MKTSALSSRHNYFEAFTAGLVIRHARGKTIDLTENVLLTNLVMNSADAHFNEQKMKASPFGKAVSYGGVNLSICIGLAAQDTAEQALAELGLDKIRFTAPVFHGDTLHAYSEVLAVNESDRADAGIVHFKHWAINQFDKVVCEGERRVLLKRISHWGDK
ncbi:MaoC family dehydratase [Variovorax sp. PCZ-1]|uniref:MaoC family dehydratase n=1 Tax=Variovorax sp. PCZ-1 TaxID=2835533 RepID=UPI001BCBB450|nr:MaoC family dehydratase [Variovorax sp. PCZ-1]MBS7806071.1 MaoC family dehydratase [Variovorax sp. PCZ-1]